MSKLYTEKEIKRRLENPLEEEITINEFIESLTPIQLPTDDEMRNNSPFKNATDYTKEEYCNFMNGAKWMRDKIKGGGE